MHIGLMFAPLYLLLITSAQAEDNQSQHRRIDVVLTFDDLPVHGPLVPGQTRLQVAERIIATLKAHGVPPTYGFINAKHLDDDPNLTVVLQRWVDSNNYLGNHTYSHMDLGRHTAEEFIADIDRNEAWLAKIAAKQNAPWKVFRYPYLNEGTPQEKRDAVRAHLQERGYSIAEVTVDFSDWAWNDPAVRCSKRNDQRALAALKRNYMQDARVVLEWSDTNARSLYKRPIPHILLLHVGAFNADMLDSILRTLEKMGVHFITLAESFQDDVYKFDPQTVGRKLLEQKVAELQYGPSIYGMEPLDLLDSLCR